jgi:hypothetical protein
VNIKFSLAINIFYEDSFHHLGSLRLPSKNALRQEVLRAPYFSFLGVRCLWLKAVPLKNSKL